MEWTFPSGVYGQPFYMCGNPNGVKFQRKFYAVNDPFHLASMTFYGLYATNIYVTL